MATHVRRQIREAIATLLTGLPTTGANIFQSRIYALQESELPGLRIYTQDESVEPMSIHAPMTQERTLELMVEAVVAQTVDLDDKLDAICMEIEIALGGSLTQVQMGGAETLILRSTAIELSGEGQKPTGIARMIYEASYFTNSNAPDVAL